jgi:16S rRNA pseudouridine516 synthase
MQVSALDVTIDGEALDHPDGILVLVNKPCGLVCSHEEREGPNVYSLLPAQWALRRPQVTSVGRCVPACVRARVWMVLVVACRWQ